MISFTRNNLNFGHSTLIFIDILIYRAKVGGSYKHYEKTWIYSVFWLTLRLKKSKIKRSQCDILPKIYCISDKLLLNQFRYFNCDSYLGKYMVSK